MTDETDEAKVLNALGTSETKFRTIRGLANDSGLVEQRVREIIVANKDKILQSPIPDIHGQTLYSLREPLPKPLGAMDPPDSEIVETESGDMQDEDGELESASSQTYEAAVKYYEEELAQVKKSFFVASIFAISGMVMFIGSLFILYYLSFKRLLRLVLLER